MGSIPVGFIYVLFERARQNDIMNSYDSVLLGASTWRGEVPRRFCRRDLDASCSKAYLLFVRRLYLLSYSVTHVTE